MAMAVKQHDVKVKFIETQFISSDAASFKSVVQRLTGKHSSPAPSHAAPAPPQRPRPCRPAFADDAVLQQQQAGYWRAHEMSGNNNGQHHHLTVPAPKQEPQRLEEPYELCDFSDLLYATGGARHDGRLPY